MATRYKPDVAKIGGLPEVDAALREIGRIERELEQIDAEAQAEIAKIKADATKRGTTGRTRIQTLSLQIGAFAEEHRAELFKDRKSLELTFGVFGYRKSSSISVKKTTLELLEKLGMERFVRVKKEADKEALAELDDETLSQVDAVRKVKDEFFCEAAREEPNKDRLAASA